MKLLITIFSILFFINLNAQDTLVHSASFNRVFEPDSNNRLIGGYFIETNDGFLVNSLHIKSDSTCVDILKLDVKGEKQWIKSLICAETNETFISIGTSPVSSTSPIVATNDGNYIMCLQRTNPENAYDPDIGIVKFTEEAEVIWLNFWEDDLNMPSALADIKPTLDGGYITSGYYNYPDLPSKGYIVKLDSAGMIEWEWLADLNTSIFYSVFEDSNGNILAGGRGANPNSGDLYVVKLSSEGELLYDFVYENVLLDTPATVVPHIKDNTYLVLGGVWKYPPTEESIRDQYIALLDSTLTPIWEKRHPSPLNGNLGFYFNAVVYPDGSFVGFQEKKAEVTDTTTYGSDTIALMWYNNEGDFQKIRTYPTLTGTHEHLTYGFGATSDGGLMLTGSIQWPGSKKTVVMKLDENGDACFPANCVEYLDYEVIYPEDTLTNDSLINDTISSLPHLIQLPMPTVSPNPADKDLVFSFGEEWVIVEDLGLSMVNAQGQVVYQETLKTNQQQNVIIDVSDWGEGFYFYRLMDGSNTIGYGKALVLHQ